MTFDAQTLTILQQSLSVEPPQGNFGRNPRKWFNRVTGINHSALPDHSINRHVVHEYCADPLNSTWLCCALICAWGGLKTSNGRLFFNDFATAEHKLEALRGSTASRLDDYASLQQLKKDDGLHGVDVAFFTKFLFFLRPKDDAYILDQWTAKSMNLLMGRDLVRLNGDYVAGNTAPAVYDEFCRAVDDLAPLIDRPTGAKAEEAIFSRGGRKPQPWRKYVRDTYRVRHG